MTLTLAITALALIAAIFLPLRWGVFGFLGAALLLFLIQVGINTSMGFAGTSIEESLLLFNGSYLSYLGYNLQITYRAFAPPLLGLAVPLIFRFSRGYPQ